MKSVLVTGASGFIGFNLVKKLSKLGYSVYALIEQNDIDGKYKLIALDNVQVFCKMDELVSDTNLPKFDTIFHLAAVGLSPNFNDIALLCDINIKMTCELISFAKNNNTNLFVNFGSCFEYGDHNGKTLVETDICIPESLYAVTKNSSVNIANMYAKDLSVNLITVRPFGVFGSGENHNRLAPQIIKSGLAKTKVKTTFGEQVRDFVNVKDIVNAVILLSESNKIGAYEIYNICSSTPISVRGFIEEIIECCQFDYNLFEFGALPYRQNEAMFFAGDNKKLLSVIDYEFPVDHNAGIVELFEEIKKEMG